MMVRGRLQCIGTTAAIVASVVCATARAADLFTEIYNRGVEKQRSMRSIRARFTETTSSTLLVRPLVAHGTIVAALPARVLMTYTDPERKIVAIDRKTLTVTWPDRRERQQIDITDVQKRIDQYFTHASIDDLRSMFEITAAADPARPGRDLVDMRPRRKQIQQGLQRLELWIDSRGDLLTDMRLTFASGDRKTVALDDIETNVPVSDETFRVE
jgi:outer membrane lipoprotein-sorting protein